jgi:hypothetical protein
VIHNALLFLWCVVLAVILWAMAGLLGGFRKALKDKKFIHELSLRSPHGINEAQTKRVVFAIWAMSEGLLFILASGVVHVISIL